MSSITRVALLSTLLRLSFGGCESAALAFVTPFATPFSRPHSSRRMSSSVGGGAGEESETRFIDIGANLLDQMYLGKYRGKQRHPADLEAVLERASAAGVDKMMVTAGSLEEARQALEMVQDRDSLYFTVGVHPTRGDTLMSSAGEAGVAAESATKESAVAQSAVVEPVADGAGAGQQDGLSAASVADVDSTQLDALLAVLLEGKRQGKAVAVGEFGLDYDRLHFCSKEVQQKAFEAQFVLTEASGLPAFFHSRACGPSGDWAFVETLKRNRDRFSTGVVHSFDGTREEAEALLDMGLSLGLNGCSLRTEESLEVVKELPLDRIMLETDCPWCEVKATHAGSSFVKTKYPSKKPERFEAGSDNLVKGRSEPCQIWQVAEIVAAVKGVEVSELARQCYGNTERMFFA